MEHVSAELARVVDAAELRLWQVSEEESGRPALSGGWSRKQLLGHLIDSASNSHQRFVRAALADAGGPLGQLQPLSGPRDSPPARRQAGSCVPDRVECTGFASLPGRGLCAAPGASSGSDWRCDAVVTVQPAAPCDDSQLGLRGI